MTGQLSEAAWSAGAAAIVALPRESPAGADDAWLGWLNSPEADDIRETLAARQRVSAWRGLLKAQPGFREIFLQFAYCPGETVTAVARVITTPGRVWGTLVEMYEAWAQLAVSGEGEAVDKRGWETAGAYLARTRWLLLSLPFRPGWEERFTPGALQRVDDSSARIVTLALRARDDWLAVLSQIDDYPSLKCEIDAEAEAVLIADVRITRDRLRAANPELNVAPGPAEQAGQKTGGRAADLAGEESTRFVITRLLLPRFALCQVRRIVYGTAGKGVKTAASAAVTVCAATMVLMALGLAGQAADLPRWTQDLLRWAPLGAGFWYAIIAVTATAWPATAWPWLLRQPASAAVGLLALAAAPPDWWYGSGGMSRGAFWAAVVLVLVGTGYLYVEAGSHGLRGRRRALRPLAVAAWGFLHALMVTFIGLRFLLPEFAARAAPQFPTADNPKKLPVDLSCWFQAGPHAGCGPAALPSWLMVLVAASWCFAAGVFLQIIWDDQPVTAPLAHVSWRRGS